MLSCGILDPLYDFIREGVRDITDDDTDEVRFLLVQCTGGNIRTVVGPEDDLLNLRAGFLGHLLGLAVQIERNRRLRNPSHLGDVLNGYLSITSHRLPPFDMLLQLTGLINLFHFTSILTKVNKAIKPPARISRAPSLRLTQDSKVSVVLNLQIKYNRRING